MSAVAHVAEVVGRSMDRRCQNCGARASGPSCGECGRDLPPRIAIGVVNGVGVNLGTVQNVYNITPAAPEVHDFRDIQDELNERFPERIPPRGADVQEVRLLPSRVPSAVVRTFNVMSYVWGGFLLLTLGSLFWYLLK